MSQNARRKFEEARYFCSMMKDTKGEEAFFYNLSAFFSAARSVTFFLQKEYSGDPDFMEWYSGEQEEMNEVPLFELIKGTRNFVLKESYPETRSIQISFSDSESGIQHTIIYGDIKLDQKMSANASERDMKYYLNMHEVSGIDWNSSIARRPICDLCDEALLELEDLLNRCEESLLGTSNSN